MTSEVAKTGEGLQEMYLRAIRERAEARAEARRLREALERIGWQGNKVLCGTCGRHVPRCDASPATEPPCRGFIARRALATTSKPAGELDTKEPR